MSERIAMFIGGHHIAIDGKFTTTTLPGRAVVLAYPEDTPVYAARAQALGYDDPATMSRDHELLHAMVAQWLGQPESPTMRGVVERPYWRHWQAEEAAVLALQKLANALGVDVLELARRQMVTWTSSVSHGSRPSPSTVSDDQEQSM